LVESLQVPLDHKSPEEVVELALKSKVTSIAFTYNEPIIWFEFVLDTARQARKNGIKTILVTNGYATEESLNELLSYTDATHVDLKAISDRFYRKVCGVPSVKPVLNTVQIIHERGIHLELSNLLIPTLNDNLSEIRLLVEWIHDTLGTKVPIHFSAFMPAYKMLDISHTPTKTVVSARQIAQKVGLEYVYTGNIRGHEGENTYCPACSQPVIKRFGSDVIEFKLKKGNICPHCQKGLKIVGEWIKSPIFQGDDQPS
jgi:pyruvate formate lyase activating enzyme